MLVSRWWCDCVRAVVWRMKPFCFVLLAVLWIVIVDAESYTDTKYGCLLAPEICTPPEDCDDLTGSCQMPSRKGDWEYRYENDWPSLVRLVEDLRSKRHDVGQEDVIRALIAHHSKLDGWKTSSYRRMQDIHTLLASQEEIANEHERSRELRRSVDGREYQTPLQKESKNSDTLAENGRLQHMKRLVKDAESALAMKGIKFSDLTPEEVQTLADFLAKVLVKDEKQQEKTNKSTDNDNFDQLKSQGKDSSLDKGTGDNKDQDMDVPVSANAVKQKPHHTVEFEELVVQPREFDDVESVSAAPNSAKPQASKASVSETKTDTLYVVIIVVGATIILLILVTIITCIVYTYRTKNGHNKKFIDTVADDDAKPFGEDYQELCRQHYTSKNSDVGETHKENIGAGTTAQDPLITRTYPLTKPVGDGSDPKHHNTASLLNQTNATRNSSVSSVSWSEEPVTANLDITTGHAVLSYMEDHLNNKDRLDKEWEEICDYEADSITTAAAITSQNSRKNRSVAALPYDHNRVKLNPKNNHLQSDYVNASFIIDNDPKRPLYIAAQGPLPSTIPDFWQMMWEQGCVAIVMLTPLVEEGVNQCTRYWPDEGSCTYHNFEIHLVSEHIWCEDYLVRSLYLKHLGTGETRTVTQFHFLSWPKDRVPSTPKPLLELRRKVTKCYMGHNSPVLVHCSDGISRTGTYILLDLAIDRMLRGAKEIDIAATLEHIRDQRVGMVANKEQFEFALTAVAEEVNAILKTLLH